MESSGFTDGSKIGDKAGAGVYGKTTMTKLSFALGSYASVFQEEIYAILACGMEIPKTSPKRRTIQICTDSQASLMAIESSKVKSRLVLDCQKILNDLASCNRVILTWVPGHSGVPGNEEADRLARLSVASLPTTNREKRKSKGNIGKKSKILSPEEIRTFIDEAPDNQFLFTKILNIIQKGPSRLGPKYAYPRVNDEDVVVI
ncbi:hypothetical protein NQ318_017432 [Aromia moschata]|uniref:RNase H type-1 domain-containing protein n=1 Tax=Aromia moschata TaxID=1265417 RepID=A0AAV8Z291_9CUCU|nr:hypothetical protein NQ318_017432 [Aromia moschata]